MLLSMTYILSKLQAHHSLLHYHRLWLLVLAGHQNI